MRGTAYRARRPFRVGLVVRAQMWASPGADVGESRRRWGRVPAQMWASPSADVGCPQVPPLEDFVHVLTKMFQVASRRATGRQPATTFCDMQPTRCSMHHTRCSVHPTRCSMHPTRGNMPLTCCNMPLTRCNMHPTRGNMPLTCCNMPLTSCNMHPTLATCAFACAPPSARASAHADA
jgi:hypothetical protein